MGTEGTETPDLSATPDPEQAPEVGTAGGARKSDPTRPIARVSAADLPCVGRNRELALVVEGFAEAAQGKGSAWLIAGPAGIGKSRLLRRVEELGRQRGFEVRTGHGIEGTLLPLFPFHEILGSALAPPTVPGRHDAGQGPVDLQILELIEHLEQASAERPQLVVVDDLQFADVESLRCFGLLVRRSRTHPLVVVAAVRTAPRIDEKAEPTLGQLRRSGLVHWVELPPLDEEARFRLLAPLLGRPVEQLRLSESVRQLVRLAGGSPYFLIELANLWPGIDQSSGPGISLAGHAPAADETVSFRLLEGPTDVQGVVLARLRELPPADRGLIGLAARAGHGFDADGLAAGLGKPPAEVAVRLARLSRDGWPIRAAGTERRFTFEHDLLRQVILDAPEFRPSGEELRRLLGWWATNRSQDPMTEARLRALSGDADGAIGCLERAIDVSIRRRAFPSVPELLRWGVHVIGGLSTEDEGLLGLYLRAGERLRELWEPTTLTELVKDLTAAMAGSDLPLRAAAWDVELLAERNIDEATHRLSELEARVAALPPAARRDARPTLEYLRAVYAFYALLPSVTHRRIARALRVLRGPGHGTERFRLHLLEIFLLSNEHRFDAAHREVARATRLMARGTLGPARLQSLMVAARCHLAFREGRALRALAEVRARALSARQLGDAGLEARPMLQLATFEYALRLTEDARRHLDEAERLFARLDSGPRIAACRLLRAWTWVLDREWTRAKHSFEEALDVCQTIDLPTTRWAATFGLALVRAETGDPQGALNALPPVNAPSLRSQAYLNEYRCVTARIRELNGDAPGALAALRLAEKGAHGTNAPRTDLVEVLGQLVRWEEAYGTRRGAAVWRARLARVRLDPKIDFAGRWKLLGGAPSAQAPAPPASGPVARRGPARPTVVGPMPERILRFLAATAGPSAALRVGELRNGFTEQEIADGLAEDRNRFARALGRLRQRGLVDRDSVRRPDTARRTFAYRLTHRGSEVAATLEPRRTG